MLNCRNSTRSLHSSDIEYITIHGRRYCGDYYMPNDEAEQERGQMLHSIYKKIFNDCLTSVPLHNPTKILDVGTGTGEWVMDMGDQYPKADVIGTDIARIQDTAGKPYFRTNLSRSSAVTGSPGAVSRPLGFLCPSISRACFLSSVSQQLSILIRLQFPGMSFSRLMMPSTRMAGLGARNLISSIFAACKELSWIGSTSTEKRSGASSPADTSR